MIGIACAHVACGRVFEPASARQSYCSTDCRHAAYNATDRGNSRVGGRQAAPYPGRPGYGGALGTGHLTQLYEVKCLACCRSTFVDLPPDRAAALRAFPPCRDCGGTVHLEMVLLTSNRRVW